MGKLDAPDWVSVRLMEANNILDHDDPNLSNLLFELAEIARKLEKDGVDPIRDPELSMLFCHATIFAAGVVEGVKSGI